MPKKVTLMVTDKGAVCINGTRITGRGTKWGIHYTIFEVSVPVTEVVNTLNKNGYGHLKLDADYAAEFGIIV